MSDRCYYSCMESCVSYICRTLFFIFGITPHNKPLLMGLRGFWIFPHYANRLYPCQWKNPVWNGRVAGKYRFPSWKKFVSRLFWVHGLSMWVSWFLYCPELFYFLLDFNWQFVSVLFFCCVWFYFWILIGSLYVFYSSVVPGFLTGFLYTRRKRSVCCYRVLRQWPHFGDIPRVVTASNVGESHQLSGKPLLLFLISLSCQNVNFIQKQLESVCIKKYGKKGFSVSGKIPFCR